MGKDKRKQEDLVALGVCAKILVYVLSGVMYPYISKTLHNSKGYMTSD